jgi:hypothetical protein
MNKQTPISPEKQDIVAHVRTHSVVTRSKFA